MGLYQKHRPKTLDDFNGNAELVESLESVLGKKSVPHAFLFHGPSGCGKTTLARIVADRLGCANSDLHEINSSNNRGIDTGRTILQEMQYKPLSGSVKIYLLDEVHQATKDFQNSMLKALEDTPAHVFFLLCTTDPDKLLDTIRNRCTKFEVRGLSDSKMSRLVRNVAKKEDKTIEKEVADKIAEAAKHSPREGLNILDSVIDLAPEKQEAAITKYEGNEQETIDLCRALIKGKSWKVMGPMVQALQGDPEKIRRAVLGYMASILYKEASDRAAVVMDCFSKPFYDTGKPGLLLACYEAGED